MDRWMERSSEDVSCTARCQTDRLTGIMAHREVEMNERMNSCSSPALNASKRLTRCEARQMNVRAGEPCLAK